MMMHIFRGTGAAILLGSFGAYLIWKGITGNVPLGIEGKPLLPKSMYILTGVVLLILPITYFVIRLTMNG
jgi:hypothetical protein